MKYNNHIPQVKNIGLQNNFHHTNKLGLAKAYQSNKSTYVDGDTMYIAGTKTAKDWYDNFTKLPFHLTKNADRYKMHSNQTHRLNILWRILLEVQWRLN